MNKNILEYSLKELTHIIEQSSFPSFRAKQIFDWIYKKGVSSFAQMRNIPEELKSFLDKEYAIYFPNVDSNQVSADGTTKYLFSLSDKEKIETVVIPTKKRATVCVSTQVGCKYSCRFCASGLKGFKRNLSTAEIVGQVLYLKKILKEEITHIVFMGVGEPFDNYDNLIKAIRIINSKEGLNIAARRITISTCGLSDKIMKFSQEKIQVELAVSLHSANNEIRSKLMPVNNIFPLKDLIKTCFDYVEETNRQITFEYLLIKDLTCTEKGAIELAQLLKGLLAKVNLIVYNEVKELNYKSPSLPEVQSFQDKLTILGVHHVLRTPRGRDISAACGQLRIRNN